MSNIWRLNLLDWGVSKDQDVQKFSDSKIINDGAHRFDTSLVA